MALRRSQRDLVDGLGSTVHRHRLVFGLGAEHIINRELARHERLLVALAIGLIVAALAWFVARTVARKERAREATEY